MGRLTDFSFIKKAGRYLPAIIGAKAPYSNSDCSLFYFSAAHSLAPFSFSFNVKALAFSMDAASSSGVA